MCSANMFFGTELSGFFAALLMCKRGKMQNVSSPSITRFQKQYSVIPSSAPSLRRRRAGLLERAERFVRPPPRADPSSRHWGAGSDPDMMWDPALVPFSVPRGSFWDFGSGNEGNSGHLPNIQVPATTTGWKALQILLLIDLKTLKELLLPHLLSSKNVTSAVPMVSHLGTAPVPLQRD